MKQILTKIGVIAFVLSGTVVLAQDSDKSKPVPSESGETQTNKNRIVSPNIDRGIFIGGTTNVTGRTNGIGQGVPGVFRGIDEGGDKSQPQTGPGKAPGVGEAPSVGKAPPIGDAPSVGNPPSVGTAPSSGGTPKIR